MEISITLPEKWNDLSQVQLENISHQLFCYHHIVKDSPESTQETEALLYFQVAKELLRHNKWKAIRVALKEIRPKAFLPLTKFIYEKVSRTKFIASVKINNTIYHAPGQRLRNITIAEFSFIDAIFYRWRNSKELIFLDVLCAALYREANNKPTDIDIRKPFVKQAVDKRADVFGKLSFKTKLAIAYTYEGCRNHIADTYPLIFPKPLVVENQTKPVKQKYVSFGQIVIDKIAGDPSKLETTNSVLMYDFLNIMSNDIKNLRKNKN